MLTQLWNRVFKPEGLEGIATPAAAEVYFELRYGNVVVGYLHHKDGKWTFKYSDAFKRSQALRPIVDFPDVNKDYQEESLWPFFASRIPSLENPHVKQRLATEKVSEKDEAGLLRLFGYRTITNPLELVATS
jgi:HipA-like protein